MVQDSLEEEVAEEVVEEVVAPAKSALCKGNGTSESHG